MVWSKYVTNTYNEELNKIVEAQRNKRSSLDRCINSANGIITKINKINQEIDDANTIVNKIQTIPGMVEPISNKMSSVSNKLQTGLKIDNIPIGSNLVSQANSIVSNINSNINNIINIIKDYIYKKNQDGNQLLEQIKKIRNDYNSILSSSPQNLGIYGPAPIFPNVPEIKTYMG